MKDALGHGSDPRGGAQAIADQHNIPTEHLQPQAPQPQPQPQAQPQAPQQQELSGSDHPGHEMMRAALAAGEKLSIHDKRALNNAEFSMTRFNNKVSGSGSDHKYVEPFPGVGRAVTTSQRNQMQVAGNRLHEKYWNK